MPRHHLPVQVSSFVGRQQELAALRLLTAGSRIVTLTGPGGIGKTRLALELGADLVDRFEDGVWFVDLSAVSQPELVVAATASALKAREHPGRPVLETLLDVLVARRMLLVLDNCEHVVDACAELVASCVRACPHVAFLTTGREPLAIAGEHVFRLQPLPSADAIALFVDRAQPVLPGSDLDIETADAIASLCDSIDGIPLAIELAAARTASMSVRDIRARITDRFALLSAGNRAAPARHRTLRATIDWSYELLNEVEREGFLCLSSFAGAFDSAAASDIWQASGLTGVQAIDLLGSLVAKSLVQAEPGGATAGYRLLDSFKEYALERLGERGTGVVATLLDRHAAIYLRRAKRLSPLEVGTKAWIDGLDADHDNLVAAFRHLVDSRQVALSLELASTLRRYWHWRGTFPTTVTLLERCLADGDTVVDAGARTQALVLLGDIYRMTDVHQAEAPLKEALGLARSCSNYELEADALETMAFVSLREGDDRRAAELCEQALTLSRLHDTPLRHARKLSVQAGVVASAEGRLDEGIAMCTEALAVFREHGSLDDAAMALNNLGWLEIERREMDASAMHLEESARIFRTLGLDVGLQVTLTNLAFAAFMKGDVEDARESLHESLALARQMGLPDVSEPCFLLALCLTSAGDLEEAALMHGVAQGFLERGEIVFWKVYEPLREADEAKLRRELGGEQFDAAWTRGRGTAADEAIEIALRTCRGDESSGDPARSAGAVHAGGASAALSPAVLHDLLEISQRLIKLSSAGDMYRAVAREATGLVPSRAAALVMRRGDHLQLVHETGWLVPEQLSAGIVGRVADSGRPSAVVTHDDPALIEPPASLIAVPLITRREVVGVMMLARAADEPYSGAELETVRSFSSIAAAAIETAENAAAALRERFVDPLTEVGNRRRFDADLATLLERADAPGPALVMADIDHFKPVNDTYGHQAGDMVLRHVATVLRQATRPGDGVYRYGGDEFCVLMPATTIEEAIEVAERLRERVAASEVNLRDGRSVNVTASFGAAATSDDVRGTLTERADAALYEAKTAGRNRAEADRG